MALAPGPRLGQRLGLAIASATGWKVEVNEPPPARCVIIGAPHTSNWDFLLALLFRFASGLDLRWVGKHTLFRWPFGGLIDRDCTEPDPADPTHTLCGFLYAGDCSASCLKVAPEGFYRMCQDQPGDESHSDAFRQVITVFDFN